MNSHDENCDKIEKYFREAFSLVAKEFNATLPKSIEDIVFCSNTNTTNQDDSFGFTSVIFEFKNYYVYFYMFNTENQLTLHAISKSFVDSSFLYLDKKYHNDYNLEPSKLEKLIIQIKETANRIIDKKINDICTNSFNLIKKLSNSKYENQKCTSKIAIFNNGFDKCLISIEMNNTSIFFEEKNIRIIRKLLQIATNDICMIVSPDSIEGEKDYIIRGFASVHDLDGKGIQVEIMGPYDIKIKEENNFDFRYLSGMYFSPYNSILSQADERKIIEHFSDDKLSKVTIDFINALKNSKEHFHGAIVIFTNDEEFIRHEQEHNRAISYKETDKLNLLDIPMDESELENEKNYLKKLLFNLCNIDGAIVFNNNGDLCLFGAILDGVSQKPGKIERGSRFNSTKTFVEHYYVANKDNNKNYLAIVMSEDGPVNVFSSKDLKDKV